MAEKMKAIRLNAPNDFEYTEVDKPSAGAYEFFAAWNPCRSAEPTLIS
jgi:hypothetical protein